MVVFYATKSELCCSKISCDMNDSEKFERICVRLLETPASIDFVDLCHQEGLSLAAADNLFYAYFGICADSFIRRLR
jgi:hypothetical protein